MLRKFFPNHPSQVRFFLLRKEAHPAIVLGFVLDKAFRGPHLP